MGCKEIQKPEVPEVDVSKLKGNISDQLPEGMSVDGLKDKAANPSFPSKLGASIGLTGKNLRAKFSKKSIETATGMSFDNPIKSIGNAIGNAIGSLADGITGAITGAIDGIKDIGKKIKNFKPGSLSLNSPEGMFGSIKNKNLSERIKEFEANRELRLAGKCGEEYAKETTKINKKIKDKTKEKAESLPAKKKVEIQKDPVKKQETEKKIEKEVKQELQKEAEEEAVTAPKEDRVIQDEVQAEEVKEVKRNILSEEFFTPATDAELRAGGIRMIEADDGTKWPFLYIGDPLQESDMSYQEHFTIEKEMVAERNSWKVTLTDSLNPNLVDRIVWWKPLNQDFLAHDQSLSSRGLYSRHKTTVATWHRARTIQWYRWFGNGGKTIRKPDGTIGYVEDENFTARDAAKYNSILAKLSDWGSQDWIGNPIYLLENSKLKMPTFKNKGFYPDDRNLTGRSKIFLRSVVPEAIVDCRRNNYQKHGNYTDETQNVPFDWRDLRDPCDVIEKYSRTEETVISTAPINDPIDSKDNQFLAFTEALKTVLDTHRDIIESGEWRHVNDLEFQFKPEEFRIKHFNVMVTIEAKRFSTHNGTKYVQKEFYFSGSCSAEADQFTYRGLLSAEGATWAEAGRKASADILNELPVILGDHMTTELS